MLTDGPWAAQDMLRVEGDDGARDGARTGPCLQHYLHGKVAARLADVCLAGGKLKVRGQWSP